MNITFEDIFKNLAMNHQVNGLSSSCSFVVSMLILPFKGPV